VEVELKLDNHNHKRGLIDMLVKTERGEEPHEGRTLTAVGDNNALASEINLT
jgi:hypothetical protein